MRGPSALKPFTTEKNRGPDCTSCIGIELQVWRGGDPRIKEKGAPVPLYEKYLPHVDIPGKFLIQTDVMKTVFYPPCKVYYTLKEGSTRHHYFAGELQSTDKRLEIHQAGRTAIGESPITAVFWQACPQANMLPCGYCLVLRPWTHKPCEGPMVLDATVGTRRDMNTLRRVVKLPRQSIVLCSAMKKSSKIWITWRRP